MKLFLRCCAIALYLSRPGPAPAEETDFASVHEKQTKELRHDSLTLNISVPKQTFFMGELIPVTFRFEDTKNTGKFKAWTGTYDRSGRIGDLKFFVDGPAGSHCDPLAVYFSNGFFGGGGLGNEAKLGMHEQAFNLNEWVRIDQPGKYRVFAISTRVSWASDNMSHHVELVSPMIEIEFRNPTPAELADTLREAMAIVGDSEHRKNTDAAFYEAMNRLRYLDTHPSRYFLRGLLGDKGGAHTAAMFGLIGTRKTEATITLLEEGINDPEVATTASYFTTLSRLRMILEMNKPKKDATPVTPPDANGVLNISYPVMSDYFGDRADWKKLVDAFDHKTGRARAVCASALFELIKNDQVQEKYAAEAKAKGQVYSWQTKERLDHAAVMAKIQVPFAESFLELAENEQRTLLERSWEIIRSPAMLPALKKIVERPMMRADQSFSSGLQSLAVLHLSELDPAAGKPLILEDVRRLRPRYSLQALCSLPVEDLKKELPLLAAHFEAHERADLDKIAGLISHIGDDSVIDVVKRQYLSKEGRWECITQQHCLAYFIKVRREEGLNLAFRAMTFRGAEDTHCYSSVPHEVLAHCYGDDVEKRMLEVLPAEREPEVIVDLTRVLLDQGTKAVINPLLDVIGRLSPKAPNEDYSYSTEAGARRHLIEGLIRQADGRYGNGKWKLTPQQQERLKNSLSSDQEKKQFQSSFEEK